MKILEKISLIVFSIIILILSVLSCLIVYEVIEINTISEYLESWIANVVFVRTVCIVSIICFVLAFKSLFFPSKAKKREEIKSGVLLENQDGRLLISRDTIENLVNSVVKSFPDAQDIQTKIFLDAENNITVFVSLFVKEDAIIKQLSSSIQTKIKETIKRNTDLDVKQVNINVKNIDNDKTKKENSVSKIKLENVKTNEQPKEEIKKESVNEKKQEVAEVKEKEEVNN